MSDDIAERAEAAQSSRWDAWEPQRTASGAHPGITGGDSGCLGALEHRVAPLERLLADREAAPA
jgi:hypothetical protein